MKNTLLLKVTTLLQSKICAKPLLGLTLHLSGHDYLKLCFLPEELLLAGGLLWKRPCRLLVDKRFRLPSSRFASLCYNGG